VATGTIAALPALPAGEVPSVVATTSIAGDVVRQVAGNVAEVTVLLPLGADPHSFEPAPRDIALMTDADAVFINGLGLEEFLGSTLENSGIDPDRIISLSEGITTRDTAAADHDHEEEHSDEHSDGHSEEHADEHSHDHSGADPHVWFSPINIMVWTDNAAAALSALDPANAETYAANAAAYKAQLEELDAFIQEQISSIPEENRELVTDHRAFGYFADRYGLTQIGAVVPAYSTVAEPSARELAALQDTIAEHQVPAIFVGRSVNPQMAEQIANDSGIALIPLYTGSLSAADGSAPTYIDMMRYNTERIVEGLGAS
jgi:ABC-type Zn uptake system ZnuABC Zn-binding protein ZnuA